MRISQIILPAFAILAIVAFVSCHSNRFYEANRVIDKAAWAAYNNMAFAVVIDDTNARYDFYLNIRNDVNYPFSNLFLFLKTTFPDQGIARDTIECLLSAPDGKWLGSGMGSVRFNRFLFQEGVRFRKAGTYVFELQQGMRVDPLKGIRDVGIRIDKHPAVTQ